MAEALCCFLVTTTALLISYTPVQNVFGVKKNKKNFFFLLKYNCFQFSSVAQSCLTLCDPMDYSTPGFPVHHQLPELAQTHVHCVGDAI